LRYLAESDADWCYGTLEAEHAGDHDTYGLFDTSRNNFVAVVGWKLQDLVKVQAPRFETAPASARPPGACHFAIEENRLRAFEGTLVAEYLADVLLDWRVTLCLLLWTCLLLLCLCSPCLLSWCQRGGQPGRPQPHADEESRGFMHKAGVPARSMKLGGSQEYEAVTSNGKVLLSRDNAVHSRNPFCCRTTARPGFQLRCIGGSPASPP